MTNQVNKGDIQEDRTPATESQVGSADELSEDELNSVAGGASHTPAPRPSDDGPTESITFVYGKTELPYSK